MQKRTSLRWMTAGFLMLGTAMAWSADFDCRKARQPFEHFICNNPALDAADTRMGEAYRRASAVFPVKGFLKVTQREFLFTYSTCMYDSKGNLETGPAAVRRCVDKVEGRTAELNAQTRSRVYSDGTREYSRDTLVVVLYALDGRNRILLRGNWMPDAYDPFNAPGFECDIDDELKPARGGFRTELTGDAVFRLSEASLNISDHIMCSARTGIDAGDYRRVR